jgi:hypothetical protein
MCLIAVWLHLAKPVRNDYDTSCTFSADTGSGAGHRVFTCNLYVSTALKSGLAKSSFSRRHNVLQIPWKPSVKWVGGEMQRSALTQQKSRISLADLILAISMA